MMICLLIVKQKEEKNESGYLKLLVVGFKKDTIKNNKINDYSKENIDIEIGSITDKKPFGEEFMNVYLLVSDKMFNEIKRENKRFTMYYLSNNPDKLQDDIDEMLQGEDYYLNNIKIKII